MAVIYGYDVASTDDRFVMLSEASDVAFSQGSSPKWIVNALPFVRYIPSWVPGASFKQYANYIKRVTAEQQTAPFQYVIDAMASGDALPSVVSSYLGKCRTENDFEMLRQVAATGYGAGVGRTGSSIINFLNAMITYPEVQKKAQEEIEAVTGGVRLPEFADQVSLPYLEAMFREVLRWKPIIPLGLPRISKEEDVYNGYYISKDTMSYVNVWAMGHDAEKYEDPETFNPDRFFTNDGELNDDHVDYAFGFGRRICPGQHHASASIWIAMATILSTFNISQAKDKSGKPIPLEAKFIENGLLNYPIPFDCSITPRSKKSKQLILEAQKSGIQSHKTADA